MQAAVPVPQPAAPVDLAANHGGLRSAPFSMHSRGVKLFESNRLLDIPGQLREAFGALRDIGSSFYTLLLIQSWLTFYNFVFTIISVAFYSFFGSNGQLASNLDWTLVTFVVLLPLLLNVAWVYWRREEAVKELAVVKTLLIHIYLAHRDWLPAANRAEAHMLRLQQLLFVLIDEFRAYFLPSRFYTRSYPYAEVKTKMMKIAQDREKQLRKINASFQRLFRTSKELRLAGLPDPQAASLYEYHYRLQCAFERLANIKEYRTLQGIRSLVRFYVVAVIPLFFGPYYAAVRLDTHSWAYALFLALMLHLAAVALLNTAMALEDPFDNKGLDGIYIDEVLCAAEQAVLMEEEEDGGHLMEATTAVTGGPVDGVMRPGQPPTPGSTAHLTTRGASPQAGPPSAVAIGTQDSNWAGSPKPASRRGADVEAPAEV